MRGLSLALALLSGLWATPTLAQSSVTTFPLGQTSTNASSTILVSNTFQQLFASNTSRRGCLVQNTGVNVMYVYVGAIAGATVAKSYPLAPATAVANPGGFFSCLSGTIVITDQISIRGTAADTFTATSQP